jgi:3-methylfumaryl-CoA hydratase
MSEVDLDYLRTWVGRERTLTDVLHPFPARALAAALDRAEVPVAGDALPPGWHWLYFLHTPRASDTGLDGHPNLNSAADSFLPPTPLRRRMWAAGRLEIERPLYLGREATRRSEIRDVQAKVGRSGPLVFITLDHELRQDGVLCIREEQNLVYREIPDAAAPLSSGERASQNADWSVTVVPDPVLLFRYSALTFNGHRIHYDRSYAVEQEFYPALVVQGPLLATMLLELVRVQLPGAVLREFCFRAVRPSFDTHPFTLNGTRSGNKLELWTANEDRQLCVTASARIT